MGISDTSEFDEQSSEESDTLPAIGESVEFSVTNPLQVDKSKFLHVFGPKSILQCMSSRH